MPKLPLQVIGAGPAGIGMVLALCNRIAAENGNATLERHLLDSLRVFEANNGPGGKMGHYQVNANTSAHDVVQGIMDGTPFTAVRDHYLEHPRTQSVLIPLSEIGDLMVAPLAQSMREFLGQRLRCETDVARIEINADSFSSFDAHNELLAHSRALLLCCGARENPLAELLPFSDRWEASTRFLSRDRLEGLPDGKRPIVIIGASHSAFSCAWRLLHDPLFADFSSKRDIIIFQRRERIKLRCTPEFAAAHDIDYDPETDICPSTGIVFFNGGLRKDARRLYLDIREGRENRVRLVQIHQLGEQQELLEQSGLILQATGFSPNLPVIEKDGAVIEVGNPSRNGELHEVESEATIPGLFGMGLGLNILPNGETRGEPSFHGGIHGFQSYPLAVAPGIIDKVMAHAYGD